MRKTPQDDADRRERQREYQRAYRERRRQAEHEAVTAARSAEQPPGEMSKALEQAMKAMKWLQPSDEALVALARLQAREIDAYSSMGTVSGRAKALRVHGLLQRTLVELGGTPRMRMQHELRSARVQRQSENAAVAAAPNVSRLRRPAKRR